MLQRPRRDARRLNTGTLLLPLAALALGAPAAAQSTTDAAVEAEIEFARGLASDWTFVGLAQGVLESVEDSGPSERMAEELGLARCELFAVGARRLRDPKEINALLEQGIEAYESFLAANEYASNREEAERGLVTMSLVYGRSIDNALEEAIGEEAQTLKDRKIEVLEGAIGRTNELIDSIEASVEGEIDNATQIAVWDLKLKIAEMYAETAEVADGQFHATQAISAYEDLSFDAGPQTEIGLRANVGAGQVYLATGDAETALDYFEGTINLVYPMSAQRREDLGFDEIAPGELQLRYTYVELGTKGLQAAARATGEYQRGIGSGLFAYNLYRAQGFDLSVEGHDAMLEFAQTLLDVGGHIGGDASAGEAKWFATEDEMKQEFRRARDRRSSVEFALDLVNQISAITGRPSTKIRAGQLLEQINSRPDIEVSPEALYEAAQGSYVAEDYDGALTGYYAVLAQLPNVDPAERIGFMAKSYNGIGNALARTGRPLQAALSFQEALEKAQDPEWNTKNAQGFLRAMRVWERDASDASKAERRLKDLRAAAERAVLSYDIGNDPGTILLRQARNLRREGRFDEAVAKYREITSEMDVYEIAQVEIGQTFYKAKRYGDAFKQFKEYIAWAEDPANATDGTAARENRRNMLSAANYYLGILSQARASGSYKRFIAARKDGKPTDALLTKARGQYQEVIDTLESFPTRFGDSDFVLEVQKILADAYAKTGQGAEASKVVEAMVAAAPDAKQTGEAAMDVYYVYQGARDELDALETVDADERTTLTRNMADALALANGIKASPGYALLYKEGKLWMELGEFERAKTTLESVVARFSEGDKATNVQRYVTPDLAEALIELGDREGAKALLAPLVIGEEAPLRTEGVTLLLCRAVFGEVVGSGTRVQQVPGVMGTDEELDFLVKRINTFGKSAEDKGDFCAYHARKFDYVFAFWVWGQENDTRRDSAPRVMNNYVSVKLFNDRQFTSVDGNCNESEELAGTYGNDVLASRFRWLLERVSR
ncbi:MAG: tetratricopeptide repeat protein [Planctomycetota bacterium]